MGVYMIPPHPRRNEAITFLNALREKIILSFEQFEETHRFQRTPWDYTSEGGGEIALLRGDLFEKAAVNWSAVGGPTFPMIDGQGPFFAIGVSLITHMKNPHAPTAHFNLRFIETSKGCWFGGGYDLTPMGFPYEEDTLHFHQEAQKALKPFNGNLYDTFSRNAKEYFYIPHRKKERGVGGLFFDHLDGENFNQNFQIWQAIGNSFLPALIPIYEKRINTPFNNQERLTQLQARSHYVEFNLLYDRGTKFGFQSGGNPDAILCSMPPVVTW